MRVLKTAFGSSREASETIGSAGSTPNSSAVGQSIETASHKPNPFRNRYRQYERAGPSAPALL